MGLRLTSPVPTMGDIPQAYLEFTSYPGVWDTSWSGEGANMSFSTGVKLEDAKVHNKSHLQMKPNAPVQKGPTFSYWSACPCTSLVCDIDGRRVRCDVPTHSLVEWFVPFSAFAQIPSPPRPAPKCTRISRELAKALTARPCTSQ